jgi:hypothetical protein
VGGVFIDGASDNQIGGTGPYKPATDSGAGNVISGNGDGGDPLVHAEGHGVAVKGSASARNLIRGNYIGVGKDGTDPVGKPLLGNKNSGAYFTAVGADNEVGGPAVDDGNTLSNHNRYGIEDEGETIKKWKNNKGWNNTLGGGLAMGGTLHADSNTFANNEGPGIIVVSGRAPPPQIPSRQQPGVDIASATDVQIDGNTIEPTSQTRSNSTALDLLVINNTIHDNEGTGVNIEGNS